MSDDACASRTRACAPSRRRGDSTCADLPSFGFGTRSLMWWGTLGLMAIEGTVFALAIMMYFYLRSQRRAWPMRTRRRPTCCWGTLNTLDPAREPACRTSWPSARPSGSTARGVQLWLVVCLAVRRRVPRRARRSSSPRSTCAGTPTPTARSSGCCSACTRRTSSPTPVDTAVLAVLFFTGPLEGKRFVDVSENALYWYFVVLSWLPIYAVIYWAPRWM